MKPAITPRTDAAQRARLEREAAALRENLRRRKQQVRARAEPPQATPNAAPDADADADWGLPPAAT